MCYRANMSGLRRGATIGAALAACLRPTASVRAGTASHPGERIRVVSGVGSGSADTLSAYLDAAAALRSRKASVELKIRWVYSGGGPCTADGSQMIIGEDRLRALDTRDGAELWRFSNPDTPSKAATPLLSGGVVYVGTSAGSPTGPVICHLYALDRHGVPIWAFAPPSRLKRPVFYEGEGGQAPPDVIVSGGFPRRPGVTNSGDVYACSDDGYLYALDPHGRMRWRTWLREWLGFVSKPPVVTKSGVWILIQHGQDDPTSLTLVSFEGRVRWTRDVIGSGGLDGISDPEPMPDGSVCFTVHHRGLLGTATPDGAIRWLLRQPWSSLSSPAVASDGTIHVGASNGNVIALRGGQELWREVLKGAVLVRPTVSPAGAVYAATQNGWLQRLDPKGNVVWSWWAGEAVQTPLLDRTIMSPPILAGDTLYLKVLVGGLRVPAGNGWFTALYVIDRGQEVP